MRLSVIVPVYRVEPYLRECVDSILGQTLPDMEVILVDDGSPDGCPAICDQYQKMDSRVQVIHKKNGGLLSARKAGIRAASGEYVTFVDSDDWIEKGMYETMGAIADRYRPDAILTDCFQDFGDRLVRYETRLPAGYHQGEEWEEQKKRLLYSGCFYHPGVYPSVWNKWFRKSLLEPNLMAAEERISLGEDMACTYPSLLSASSVYIYKETCFYHYRWRQGSMIQKHDESYFSKYAELYRYLYRRFEELGRTDAAEQLPYHQVYSLLVGLIRETGGRKEILSGESRRNLRSCYQNKAIRWSVSRVPLEDMELPAVYRMAYQAFIERRTSLTIALTILMRGWMRFFWNKK